MHRSPTLRRLVTELEESLMRLEAHFRLTQSQDVRGPLLRRRRALAVLNRQMRAPGKRPLAPIATALPPSLADLIAAERSLVEAYRAALAEHQGDPALSLLLTTQKSETEQALLAFVIRQKRG